MIKIRTYLIFILFVLRFIPEYHIYAIQDDITVKTRDFSIKHAVCFQVLLNKRQLLEETHQQQLQYEGQHIQQNI